MQESIFEAKSLRPALSALNQMPNPCKFLHKLEIKRDLWAVCAACFWPGLWARNNTCGLGATWAVAGVANMTFICGQVVCPND